MKNLVFSRAKLLTAAALLAFVVLFTGCKEPVPSDTELALDGKWLSSHGENFTFDMKAKTFENDSYAGNKAVIVEETKDSGYIYIKYTKAYDWNKGQEEEPDNKEGWLESWGTWYPTDSSKIGKWYAIYYSNLTENSVEFSGALGEKGCTDTLKEAENEFTVENGYFASSSECSKVTE